MLAGSSVVAVLAGVWIDRPALLPRDDRQDRAIEGTGLGLTIVDAIVRAHRGAIEVTSDAGQGTTFRVRLPVAGPATEKVGSPDRPAETVICPVTDARPAEPS